MPATATPNDSGSQRYFVIPQQLPTLEHDLTDEQWEAVSCVFPSKHAPRVPGRPRVLDCRAVLNGILYRRARGCSWREVPSRYGNRSSLNNYDRQWSQDGTLHRVAVRLRIGELQPFYDECSRLIRYDEKMQRRAEMAATNVARRSVAE